MIYREAGSHQLRFVFDKSYPQISDSERDDIANYWANLSKGNDNLTNDPHVCAHSYIESNGLATIWWNIEGYATYSYFREHKIARPGTYSVGVGTVIYLHGSDEYVFVERTKNVVFDKGKISIGAGGTLDTPTQPFDDMDMMNFIHNHGIAEVGQELITHNITPPVLLGYYIDPDTHKVEFVYTSAADSAQVPDGNTENSRVVTIPRGQLTSSIHNEPERFEESTKNILNHWSDYLDKEHP